MIVGIFVGGKSSRMGGAPKGLLTALDSSEPLLVRTSGLVRSLGFTPVLVGAAQAYRALLPTLARLDDEPAGVGPLGGLSALLRAAAGERTIAVACDMPLLSASLLQKLADTQSAADVLAPRGTAGFWEPLCARYDAARVTPRLQDALARGVRSFQALFVELSVAELQLAASAREQLVDWDSPEDLTRSRG